MLGDFQSDRIRQTIPHIYYSAWEETHSNITVSLSIIFAKY